MNPASRRFLHNHSNMATEGSPKSELCPTLIEWLQFFFIVHSTIDSTAHSRPLNILEPCICTTSMYKYFVHILYIYCDCLFFFVLKSRLTSATLLLGLYKENKYVYNLDGKHPTRPRFEPSSSELWAATGQSEQEIGKKMDNGYLLTLKALN